MFPKATIFFHLPVVCENWACTGQPAMLQVRVMLTWRSLQFLQLVCWCSGRTKHCRSHHVVHVLLTWHLQVDVMVADKDAGRKP